MGKSKVFIIGIDGGTWNILRPLIENGTMPNLAKLEREGISSTLKSTMPPVTAPAWVSFQTGVRPENHGIFEFNNYVPGTYRTFFINSSVIPLKTIWQIASEAGRKVIAVNVPVTYPPYKVNGCMVTGLLTPNTKHIFTYPEELCQEILEKVPAYKIMTTRNVYNLKGLNAFLKALIDTERKRTEVMLYLMQKNDWDIAMIHYQSSDELQHSVYRHLDPANPFFEANKYNRIKSFYRQLDKNIGNLLAQVPDSAIKIVLSDHGFCPVYKKINLNAFLRDNGWLAVNKRKLFSVIIDKIFWFATKIDRFNLNTALLRKGKRKKFINSLFGGLIINWQKTRAFMINGWVYGNIYINLIDREKNGVVALEDYDSLCEQIKQKLLDLRDKDNSFVIENVYKREEVYNGKYRMSAPDLLVMAKQGYNFNTNVFERTTIFSKNKNRRDHQGSHDINGILVISGANPRQLLYPPSIVDLCPTILNLLGIAVPDYMDGNILDIFPDIKVLEKRPGQDKEGIGAHLSPKDFSKDDERIIQKRLEDLGYI